MGLTKTKIDVLDHGSVRLVSYMQPVEQSDEWNGDLEICRNARVSYNAEFRTGKDCGKDEKLIKYLYFNNHTSPFESMVFTFQIECPLFVARQWMRHRTWSYNEVSARYTELPNTLYVPHPEKIGYQHSSNKQMRTDSAECREDISVIIHEANQAAYNTYLKLLEMEVPRELARGVLPTNIYTRFFGTVNLHNFLKFLHLRDHPHAQPEIQVYAKAMWELIKPLVPYTAKAHEEKFNVDSSK